MSIAWLFSGGVAPVATNSVTASLEAEFDLFMNTALHDGARGYWRSEELTGVVAYDSSGNDYDGTYVGGVTLGQPGALGDDSKGVRFDGSTGYIDVGNILEFDFAGAFSIEMFVKLDAGTHDYYIIGKGLTVGRGYSMYITATGAVEFLAATAADVSIFNVTSSVTGINDGAYHHIIATYTGTTAANGVKVYVDNVVTSGTASAGAQGSFSYPFRIGALNAAGKLAGGVDETIIYPGLVLTPTQVAAHYALRLTPKWTNILNAARSLGPIVCEYGVQGNSPLDRIANTGRLDFLMDNSTLSGLLGQYSPLHVNRRLGFDFNVPIRIGYVSGTLTVYKFFGLLADIIPVPGVHENRTVACTAVDKMDEYANLDLPDLPVQFDKRPDQLITSVLNALSPMDQPLIRDIDLGSETYEMALDGGATGTRPKVREVLNQLALSELGYIYFKGNSYSGGVFTFENRHRRSLSLTPAVSVVDLDPGGFSVPGSRDDIYSRVQVLVRPTRVDAAPTTVLYSLQTTSTQLRPSEINSTLFGPYRDPNNTGTQIGGTETIDPAPGTDYTMNTLSDGTGTDLTANFIVAASRTGLGVRFTITNLGLVPGYITKLQVRGKGIYRSLTTIDVAVPSGYGNRIFTLDMPFQTDVNVATDVAYYTANILSRPFARVPSARFIANLTPELMLNALLREPGDRVHIREEMTGVDDDFYINSVKLELVEGHLLWCTWGLAQANTTQFWFIGVPGFSEIGVTTVLGF